MSKVANFNLFPVAGQAMQGCWHNQLIQSLYKRYLITAYNMMAEHLWSQNLVQKSKNLNLAHNILCKVMALVW